MSRVAELLCSRRVPQVAVLALMSVGFAGCSADMQTRFSDSSFSNPFASQPEATGSVRTPAVERRELPQYARPQPQYPQYQSQALPPPRSRRRTPIRPVPAACPAAGAAFRPMRRRPSRRLRPPARSRRVRSPPPVRLAQGGTTIIVGTSDTLDTLAQRYNVRRAAILQANGYKGPRALSPGQQLIIPRQTSAAPAPALRPGQQAGRRGGGAVSVHVVNRGDTLMSIARRNHVPVAELARANNLDQSAKLKLGMKLTVPGAKPRPLHRRRSPRRSTRPAARSGCGPPPSWPPPVASRKARGWRRRPPSRRRKARRRSGRSRPAKAPARCRHSAGRCAAG